MRSCAIRFSGFFGAALALALSALGGTAPAPSAPPRSVNLFTILCLRQLPALDDIAKAAGFGEFAELIGDELAPYRTEAPGEELRAWLFHEPEGAFVLTAAKSGPDARHISEAPEFARATNFACSLRIPPNNDEGTVLSGLTQILGRGPDQTGQEGLRRVLTWRERTAKHLSHVDYYPPPPGGGTAELRARMLLKD